MEVDSQALFAARRSSDEAIPIQQEMQPYSKQADWLDSMEATGQKLQRALEPYRGILGMSFGIIACFYGRHFPYSVLFWRAWARCGWPIARSTAIELRQRYYAAQAAARREFTDMPSFQEASAQAQQTFHRMQGLAATYQEVQQTGDAESIQELATGMEALQAEVGSAQRAGSAIAAVSAELQPQRLLELARGLYAAVTTSLRAAMLDGAAALGFSANMGDVVATAVNSVAAPWFRSIVDFAATRSGCEVSQLCEDQNAKRWIDLGINGLCNSLGIMAAFFVESRLFALANSRMGAQVMVQEASAWLVTKGLLQEVPQSVSGGAFLAEWALFAAGAYYQFVQGTHSSLGVLWRWTWRPRRMSAPLRLALSVPLSSETWLQGIVAAMRVGV